LFEFLVTSLSLLGACYGIVGVIAEAGEFLQESAEVRYVKQQDHLFDFIHEEEVTIAVVVVGLSYIDGHVAEPSTGCNYMVRDQQVFFPR